MGDIYTNTVELPIKKKVNALFWAVLTTLSFYMQNSVISDEYVNVFKNKEIVGGILKALVKFQLLFQSTYGITSCIVCGLILTVFLLWEAQNRGGTAREKCQAGIVAAFFSFCSMFGYSFMSTYSWDLIFYSRFHFVISLLLGISLARFYYVIIRFYLKWLDYSRGSQAAVSERIYNPISGIVFMIIMYLPYNIAFYPGTINWDAMWQLNMFCGGTQWTSHHPTMSTAVFGIIYKIGRFIGGANFGIFLIAFLQEALIIFTVNFIIGELNKRGLRYKYCIMLLLWFSLCTMWPINSITVVKDVPYSISFVWFLYAIDKAIHDSAKWKDIIIIGITVAFLVWMRNDGKFVAMLMLACIAVNKKIKSKRNILLAIAFSIFISLFTTSIVENVNSVKKGSIREAFSIPFQQTARYVKECGDEVTEEEKSAIDKVLKYDLLPERYTPETSDPVKDTFRDECTTEELKNYFKIWAKMMVKKPGIYIQATMNGAYGYFYPSRKEYKDGLGTYELPDKQYVGYVDEDIVFNPRLENMRLVISEFAEAIRVCPLLGMMYSCGIYTWILVLLILTGVHKGLDNIIYLPLILNLLVCVASPVNAYLRYMMPTMMAIPFLIASLFVRLRIIADNDI